VVKIKLIITGETAKDISLTNVLIVVKLFLRTLTPFILMIILVLDMFIVFFNLKHKLVVFVQLVGLVV
jgi:hypothetical protein